MMIIIIECFLIVPICNLIKSVIYIHDYYSLILCGLFVFLITSFLAILINYFVYKKQFLEMIKVLKGIKLKTSLNSK